MKVLTADLKRLLYNALLFSNKKATAEGVVVLTIAHGWLVATSTDDHVAFQDRIPIEEERTGTSYLPFDSVKPFLEELETSGETHEFFLSGTNHDGVDESFWEMVFDYLSLKDFKNISTRQETVFALNPNRLRKFGLVKTVGKSEYPIDFLYGVIQDRDVLAFKVGPTAHGVLAPLLRSVVADTLSDSEEAMW